MYEQALAVTKLSYDTLAHAKAVAARLDFRRRRLNLGWSHHREVAYINDPAEQDRLLDEAEKNGWSQKALRTVIRDRYPKSGTPKTEGKLPQRRRALAKGAPEDEDVLDRLAAPPAQERVLAINAAVDCSSAALIEEAAPEEDGDRPIEAERAGDSARTVDGIANGEIACSETADAVVDNGNDAAGLDAPASGTPVQSATSPSDEVRELSETPSPEEHDNTSQEMARVCPDALQPVVTSADLPIYPDVDPYGERDPLWVRGALQSIGPLTQELSTLEHIPNCSRITEVVLQLIDALAPVCLENPITEENREKIVNLLQYCGYKNFTDQLLHHWAEADAAIAEAQTEMLCQESSPSG